MDDFLYNIRYGNNKRFDRNRKTNENNPQYRNSDKYGNRDRKSGNVRRVKKTDNLEGIGKNLESLVLLQERLAEALEANTEYEKRKALALESIAHRLSVLESIPMSGRIQQSGFAEDVDFGTSTNPQVQEIVKRSDHREKLLELIHDLRLKGLSYDRVSKYLTAEKIPTLSGSGKWYAATVSRLYKEFAP